MSQALTDLAALIAEAHAEARLAQAIDLLAARSPDRPAFVIDAGGGEPQRIDFATLAAAVRRFEERLEAVRPVGVVARATRPDALVTITAACGRRHVPVALLADDAHDLLGELHDWVTVGDALELPPGRQPVRGDLATEPRHVVVATSGTSGPPRLVTHTFDALLAAVRQAEQWQGIGWLLAYDATRWAGVQVWVQSLLTGGRLVVPASREPDTVARALVDEGVSVLPATPTLLRRLLTSADRETLGRANLERITLGGEAADAALLTQVQAAFPQARITQIYATTELGEVFRVTDGLPGFPAAWLGRTLPGGVRLSTRRDGELLVQLSRDTAEVGTGDFVERRGDRFEFTGRRSDVIVVGGAKVLPRRLEEVLRRVPGVADTRVYGMPSAITGELVAAEIVLVEPLPEAADPETVREAALAACRAAVEPHAVPRILDVVKRIATTPAGKVARRPVALATP